MPADLRVASGWLARYLPHGWRDFWLQFVVFWIFNLSYEGSRGLSDGARSEALANGQRVIDAEQQLGLYCELDLQHWVLHDAPGLFLSARELDLLQLPVHDLVRLPAVGLLPAQPRLLLRRAT